MPALHLIALELGGELFQLLCARTLMQRRVSAALPGEGRPLAAVPALLLLLLLLLFDPAAEVLIEAELFASRQHH